MASPANHLNLNINEAAALALEYGIHEPPEDWFTAADISCESVDRVEIPHLCSEPRSAFEPIRYGGATLHRFIRSLGRPIWVGRCRKCGMVCWSSM